MHENWIQQFFESQYQSLNSINTPLDQYNCILHRQEEVHGHRHCYKTLSYDGPIFGLDHDRTGPLREAKIERERWDRLLSHISGWDCILEMALRFGNYHKGKAPIQDFGCIQQIIVLVRERKGERFVITTIIIKKIFELTCVYFKKSYKFWN